MQTFGIIMVIVGLSIALATKLIKAPNNIDFGIKPDEDEEYDSDEDDIRFLTKTFTTIIKVAGLVFVTAGIVVFFLYFI